MYKKKLAVAIHAASSPIFGAFIYGLENDITEEHVWTRIIQHATCADCTQGSNSSAVW